MSTKALIIGVVGAGSVAAAGMGGFLAQRIQVAEPSIEATVASDMVAPANTAQTAPDRPVATLDDASQGSHQASARVDAAPRAAATVPAIAPAATAAPTPAPAPVEPAAAPVVEVAEVPAPLDVTASTGLPPSREGTLPAVSMPPPPAPSRWVELTLDPDAVIGIRLEAGISSATAEIEDRVIARVSRDVIVGERTAIPAGARIEGDVVLVERGGRFRERARLGIKFSRVVLSDETTVRIRTEPIFRDGESPTGEATSKIGASAVIGAILGGVIGGKRGAAIGGTAGAAGGTAAVAAGGANAASIAEGSALTLRLTAPVTLLVERDRPRH
jgi:hypothetical protein